MIDTQQIQAMCDFIEQQGLNEQTLIELRQQYTDLFFTWCMDDEINYPHPISEREGFNVFLVDSRDHCSTLTKNADIASGVVFAEILPED